MAEPTEEEITAALVSLLHDGVAPPDRDVVRRALVAAYAAAPKLTDMDDVKLWHTYVNAREELQRREQGRPTPKPDSEAVYHYEPWSEVLTRRVAGQRLETQNLLPISAVAPGCPWCGKLASEHADYEVCDSPRLETENPPND